jgi:hypothetical protein
MPGVRLLHRVNGEHTNRIDAQGFQALVDGDSHERSS